ncbi:MAG: PKD domain-containing protein, partial [Saprospiraceae bacterium]|nr:PKD domain-containing protein [Saprospiraceae bacterium]
DKLQFDPTGRYVLGMEVDFEHRSPKPDDVIQVGIIDLHEGDRWIPLGQSRAWNWQQGCMLQWVPGSGSTVLWNDREGDRFVCRILDVKTKKLRTIPAAIYTLRPDGQSAITTDFRRLNDVRPGYGYAGIPDPATELAPRDSGIWTVSLVTGKQELLFSVAEIAKFGDTTDDMKEAKHWFNHLLINPDGSLPWGINGSDFSTQTAFFEREVQIAFQSGSEVVWAICEYSDNSQGSVGEYVQKFDKTTGNRLLSNLGKEVYPVSPDYISHRGELQLIDDQPVFLISDGNSNGVFPKDILAVYLDANGDFFWPEHTRPMGTNDNGVKSRTHLNRPFNGQVTGAWTEDRPEVGGSRAYAQNLQLGCIGPVAGFSTGVSELHVSFASTASNADSIFWDLGDGTSATGSNAVHVYAEAGTYNICQFVANTCGTDTLCQLLQVSCTPPFAEYSFATDALEVAFSGIVLNADSLAWDFGDGSSSGENNPTHLYAASGTYLVCLFAFNTCEVDTFCQEVAVVVNSAGSLSYDFGLQVFPNPNDGGFSLELDLPEAAHCSYALRMATGQSVQEQSLELGSGKQRLSIRTDLPAGIYFLRVAVDGKQRVIPVAVR